MTIIVGLVLESYLLATLKVVISKLLISELSVPEIKGFSPVLSSPTQRQGTPDNMGSPLDEMYCIINCFQIYVPLPREQYRPLQLCQLMQPQILERQEEENEEKIQLLQGEEHLVPGAISLSSPKDTFP